MSYLDLLDQVTAMGPPKQLSCLYMAAMQNSNYTSLKINESKIENKCEYAYNMKNTLKNHCAKTWSNLMDIISKYELLCMNENLSSIN